MKKRDLISILLYDVALEHSAIVQYMYHIFLIKDRGIAGEIEKIARQEMRHMKWFAHKVVQLGGDVELERIEECIKIGGPDIKSMLKNDIGAEELAINSYTRQLEEVKDDDVKRLLERVIKDERRHRHEFEELLEHAEDSKEEGSSGVDEEILQLLNTLLKEEYRIILGCLYSFFRSKNWEVRDVMLDLAIESMVHMGELGEKIGELGGKPDLSMPKVSAEDGVEEHILYEESAKEEYMKKAERVSDPSLRSLLEWIEAHEDYHKQKLVEVLRSLHRFTVGDLRHRPSR